MKICRIFFIFLLLNGSGLCNDDYTAPSVDSPLFHEFPWTSESQEDSQVASSNPQDEIISAEVTSRLPYSTVSNYNDGKINRPSSISIISELTEVIPKKNETLTQDALISAATNMSAVSLAPNDTSNNISLPEVLTEVGKRANRTNLPSSEAPTKPLTVQTENRSGSYTLGSPIAAADFLQPTESAAILAAVFIAVALIGYFGLVLWRQVLEKRYGNRELLVNEEFYDVNDLKYFEL